MKKDAYYFPHFSNARNDSKLVKLRRIMGIEGYGMYFLLLEVLREQTEFKLPLTSLEDLAYDWHTSKEKLLTIISNFDLFEIIEENFISPKLIFYLQPYIEKSQRARKASLIRWDNAKAIQMHTKTDANALQMDNKCNADEVQTQCTSNASKVKESKVKKTKVKESKVKEIKTGKHLFSSSPYSDFEFFKNSLDDKFHKYDLEYYHEVARGYSESKGAMYKDWLAAIRNWMLRDMNDGKVRIVNERLNDDERKAERMEKIKQAYNKLNN